jgi:peptidoglycan/xylan/chitin deacetylase (PgdA/CDA1 family)
VRALALLYHDVVPPDDSNASGFPGPSAASYKLSSSEFARHLAAVSAVAARRGTVWELASADSGTPPVFLTFDDGGASASGVADLLEGAGWRGHFFITTDYLGEPGFVTPAQVRDLAARGHVIGTHSCSHPVRMATCPPERLLGEWVRSTGVLGDILGETVRVGSVPFGASSPRVVGAAAAAGMTALFTSEPTTRCHSVDGCTVIGRFALRRDTPAAVAAALASGDLGVRLRQFWSWNLKKLAKAVGGDAYLALREALYNRRREPGSR